MCRLHTATDMIFGSIRMLPAAKNFIDLTTVVVAGFRVQLSSASEQRAVYEFNNPIRNPAGGP